jgi:polyhydroxyalkanoate synthesis regulator phasin
MAQNEIIKRYLDAGMAFTQLSRERAEEFVKDLVKAGEVRRKEAEETVEALVERSRKNTEELVAVIRREIADQLRNLGLEDLVKRAGLPGAAGDRVEDAAGAVDEAAHEAAAAVAPKKAPAKKAAAKKAAPPASTSGLVVPGAPKKAAAKKLVVPTGVASPAPAKKAAKAAKAAKATKKS